MDITPDDAVEMNKKKRMMRWDAKKRKFVKVCSSKRDFKLYIYDIFIFL